MEVRGQPVAVFSFHFVGSWDRTQAIRLRGRHVYTPSHLVGPTSDFLRRYKQLPGPFKAVD